MAENIPESEFTSVLRSFGIKSFSTKDFSVRLKGMYPETWNRLELEYGRGGKGAGKHYSIYSRISQTLHYWSTKEALTKAGYVPAPGDWGSPLIRTWNGPHEFVDHLFPDELSGQEDFTEGGVSRVLVNKYERDPKARAECIAYHGCICKVCNFDFEKKYGELGAGFIHVHHKVPLSKAGGEYKVEPREDLIPVCPNCHAMLHRTGTVLSISELKKCIEVTE